MDHLPLQVEHWRGDKFRVDGNLVLTFRTTAHGDSLPVQSQTIVDVGEQTPPLRMIRAFALADGAALAHLHNVSGGVLGGDRLRVNLTVQPRAQAQVTTAGATRVYRHRRGYPDAEQTTTIDVGEGALLEYLPDVLIPSPVRAMLSGRMSAWPTMPVSLCGS